MGVFRKNKLFFKYLFSYIMVLMVPVLAFTGFIEHNLMGELHNRFEVENVQAQRQFTAVADDNLSRLDTIKNHLLTNDDLELKKGLSDVPSALRLIKELKTYTVSNSAFSDLVFWIDGDDYIYTSHGSYRLDDFFSGRFYYQNWTTDEFVQEAKGLRGREIRPQEPVFINGVRQACLTVIYPMEYRQTPVIMMFLIDANHLFPMNPSSAYFILKGSGKILYANYEGENDWPSLLDIPWKMSHGTDVQRVLYKGFMATKEASEVTGLTYLRLSPEREVFGQLQIIRRKFYVILGFLLCAGCFLIWAGMALNYRPLQRCWLFVSRLGGGGGFGAFPGVKGIQAAIEGLVCENQELKDSTYDASKGHFIYLLIKERISGEEFLKKAGQLSMEDLLLSCVFVLIVAVKKEEVGKVPQGEVEEIIRKRLPGYLREYGEHGEFVFVGSTNSPDSLVFHHKALDVLADLKARLPVDVVVAKSGLSKGVKGIPRCYMEAMLAADYRFIKGYNCVIDSAMVPMSKEMTSAYPRQLFEKLNYQVQNWDADRIQECLRQIIKYVKTTELPLYYAKGLCCQLMNEIQGVIMRLNQELSRPNRLSYATILADYDTVDELIGAVENICLNICAFMRDEKAREEEKRISDIKEYVKGRALCPDFTIQGMAADFHMTLPALSAFFKDRCSVTLKDYVVRLRMDEAARLLVEEGLAVHEIVERVGYLNESSFIRKFKSIYGVTPGQYARQFKGE